MKIQAQTLYFQTDYSQKKISEMLNISTRTLWRWIKEGNWKRAKAAAATSPILLAEQYYSHLAAINEHISNRTDSPFPTKEESEIMRRIVGTLSTLKARLSIPEVTEVIERFVDSIPTKDKAIKTEINYYKWKFIELMAQKKKPVVAAKEDNDLLEYQEYLNDLYADGSLDAAADKNKTNKTFCDTDETSDDMPETATGADSAAEMSAFIAEKNNHQKKRLSLKDLPIIPLKPITKYKPGQEYKESIEGSISYKVKDDGYPDQEHIQNEQGEKHWYWRGIRYDHIYSNGQTHYGYSLVERIYIALARGDNDRAQRLIKMEEDIPDLELFGCE